MGKAWWWGTCTLTNTHHRPSAQTQPRQDDAFALRVRPWAAGKMAHLPNSYCLQKVDTGKHTWANYFMCAYKVSCRRVSASKR